MSLEEKFAALKIDDVAAIVDAVKKDGVKKSGFADSIASLTAKVESKDEAEALAGLETVAKLAEECPEAQAFTKETLGACKFACCASSPALIIRRISAHTLLYLNRLGTSYFQERRCKK